VNKTLLRLRQVLRLASAGLALLIASQSAQGTLPTAAYEVSTVAGAARDGYAASVTGYAFQGDPSPNPPPESPQTPIPDPPDDNDGDPADFTQTLLAAVPPLALGALIGGSVVFYLVRRAKRRPTP
jgi:hypothetical protein